MSFNHAAFLLDENLSWRLIKKLQLNFGVVKHINEFSNQKVLSDLEIWKICLNKNFTIITIDEDFEDISVLRGFPPKVIIIRRQNLSSNQIAELLLTNTNSITEFLNENVNGILEIF